jgi:hypothetical protein
MSRGQGVIGVGVGANGLISWGDSSTQSDHVHDHTDDLRERSVNAPC